MTPLGSSIWDLMSDPRLSPRNRYVRSWNLWSSEEEKTVLYASQFALACLIGFSMTCEPGANYEPPDFSRANQGPLTDDEVQEVHARAWNHLGSLLASQDLGADDPTAMSDVAGIAVDFEGAAVYMFAYFGNLLLSELKVSNDEAVFFEHFAWIETEVARIDRHYADASWTLPE